MSTTLELMCELTKLGICVEVCGDQLKVSPASRVTSELKARLVANKPALLAALTIERRPRSESVGLDCSMPSIAPSLKPARAAGAATGCKVHIDHRDWQDDDGTRRPGWILTTCRLCGKFIGYRPSNN